VVRRQPGGQAAQQRVEEEVEARLDSAEVMALLLGAQPADNGVAEDEPARVINDPQSDTPLIIPVHRPGHRDRRDPGTPAVAS
jgi:hypothetical protein